MTSTCAAAAPTTIRSGIHLLDIPVGLPVRQVNVYLLEGDPLTLIDTGPDAASALAALERGLATLGHRVEDLGLIVLTHHHVEHVGLAGLLARRSGAQVAGLAPIAPYLADYARQRACDDAFDAALMARHGVDPGMVALYENDVAVMRAVGAPVRVGRPLADGDRLDAGAATLEVCHRPGHSESDVVLRDRAGGVVFTGDHLLARISSNALVTRPLGTPGDVDRRPRSLLAYRDSLRATRALDADVALAAHGPPVEDHRALVDRRLRRQELRAERIVELLAEGPSSAFALALRIWRRRALQEPYLVISEVLGHLDLAAAQGAVTEDPSGPVVRFARA